MKPKVQLDKPLGSLALIVGTDENRTWRHDTLGNPNSSSHPRMAQRSSAWTRLLQRFWQRGSPDDANSPPGKKQIRPPSWGPYPMAMGESTARNSTDFPIKPVRSSGFPHLQRQAHLFWKTTPQTPGFFWQVAWMFWCFSRQSQFKPIQSRIPFNP